MKKLIVVSVSAIAAIIAMGLCFEAMALKEEGTTIRPIKKPSESQYRVLEPPEERAHPTVEAEDSEKREEAIHPTVKGCEAVHVLNDGTEELWTIVPGGHDLYCCSSEGYKRFECLKKKAFALKSAMQYILVFIGRRGWSLSYSERQDLWDFLDNCRWPNWHSVEDGDIKAQEGYVRCTYDFYRNRFKPALDAVFERICSK